MEVYTEIELVKLYVRKAKQLGRLPKAVEINNDPDMPSYTTLLNKVGGKKVLIEKMSFYIDFRKYRSCFCKDCIYDPRVCGKDYDDCLKEADLYFKMLDKKTLEF